jgi:DNA-binding response OmpR family regulator
VSRRRVAVLAEDLIWATRLGTAVERSGALADRVRDAGGFDLVLDGADGAIVDMTARGYDPIEAIQHARESGVATVAVGQHEDLEQRRLALDAGARRVVTYNAFFRGGQRIVEELLEAAAER